MSATPNWTEIVLAAAAVAAAGIAWLARNDAKLSADAAANAHKIARADLLNVHFQNVAYLLDVASDKIGGGDSVKVEAGKQSVKALGAFIEDAELQDIFARLPDLLKKSDEARMRATVGLPYAPTPTEVSALLQVFERKRRQYVGIQ